MALSNVTETLRRQMFVLLIAGVLLGFSNAIQFNSLFISPFNSVKLHQNGRNTKCCHHYIFANVCGRRNSCVGWFYDNTLSACLHIDPTATSDCVYFNSLTLTSCKRSSDTYPRMALSNVTETLRRPVFVLLLACVLLGLSNAIQSNSLFISPFNSANCINTLEIQNVATIIQCASLCGRRNGCVGWFYDNILSACLHVDPTATSDCVYFNSLTLTSWKRSPFIGRCSEYLVPGVPDNQMTSSSHGNADWPGFDVRAHHGRLNIGQFTTTEGLVTVGAWMANYTIGVPWIQIQFNASMVVNGIATQGRFFDSPCCLADQRVTKYTISYSEDCSTFTSILKANGEIKNFTGNLIENSNAIQTNMLEFPVYALCIRLYPTERIVDWGLGGSDAVPLRLDVIGCEYN